MTAATTPNPGIPGLEGYDDTNHQVVKLRAKNITTDSSVTPNVVVGDLGVDVEITATAVVASNGATGAAVPADADYIGFNNGGNLQGVSSANPLPVAAQHASAVDATNSSTTLLTANSVFTGTSQSSLPYSALSLEVFADQASAANGLNVEQSTDGTNWDIQDKFTISASTAFQTSINLIGSKYRVIYTNGGTNQGAFRLQTVTQTQDVVLPRTLTVLGNLKSSLQEINGQTPTLDNTTILATSMRGKGAGTAGDTALLLDLLGQMTVEQFVQYQIMQGHGFSATTTYLTTNATNAFICQQLAVNNIAKKVLIFDIACQVGNVAPDCRIYTASVATADSNLTTALTAYNMQPKSATTSSATTIAASPASTTQTSGFTGSVSSTFSLPANQTIHILQQSAFFYFANGDTASVEVAMKIPTSGNSGGMTFYWVEWT